MKVKLYSTAPNGHFRAGQHINNAGVEVETDGLTKNQLDAINEDPRLVRPDNWPETYTQALAALDQVPEVAAPAQTAKKAKA